MRKLLINLASVGIAVAMTTSVAFAQDADPVGVSLSNVVAQNDDTVEIEFDFQGNGESQAFGAVNINYDPNGISDIDLSNCLDGHDATIMTSCVFPAGGDHTGGQIRLLLASENPLGDFTGTIYFELDGTLSDGDVIDLEWSDLLAEDPDADVEGTDGSITIEAAADDGSELAVTPTSHDFGTINVGDSDSTTFTAENVGDADLDITDVGISGDSQFTIANDGCNGQTLTPGDTCEVDVDFDGDAEGTYSAEITFESDADVNDEAIVEVFGEVAEDNGADEGFTVDFDGGLGTGDAGETLDSTGTVVYEGDTSGSLSCELSGDVFSSNPDPLDFTFAESGSEEFTISCTLPEDAEDGQDYGGALSCTDENDEVVYSGELSCSVTADEPEPTPAVPVPTMQSWGIALFSLIMLAIGGLSIRAFRS